jgi:hypothetical protein
MGRNAGIAKITKKGRERSDFVPKGLEDSARGFNPGIDQSKKNPPRRGGRGLAAIYAPINNTQNRYLPPLQGGPFFLSVRGVKTPGLVL